MNIDEQVRFEVNEHIIDRVSHELWFYTATSVWNKVSSENTTKVQSAITIQIQSHIMEHLNEYQ